MSRNFETEKETLRRWGSGYVTERERRICKEIRLRESSGYLVTPAQIAFAANVEAVLAGAP